MQGVEKLRQDLEILEKMAEEMDEYLRSDVLFWPTRRSDFPQVTIGGYLLRQHRLLDLRHLLSMEEQKRLHEAINLYNEALEEKVVRFENKAHEELGARLRQWGEYLNEVKQGKNIAYYESAVDARAMMEVLMAQLRVPPYRLEDEIPRQVALLDRELSRIWKQGEFIWPREWQPAYPHGEYWWLYGQPREPEQ